MPIKDRLLTNTGLIQYHDDVNNFVTVKCEQRQRLEANK